MFKGKSILIVDDSKLIRFMLSREFTEKGCHVIEAMDGVQGVWFAKKHKPDLIIMDLVMPKMGGLGAIEKIRETLPQVPIIVLTSTTKKEDVIQAASYKVAGYIKKPIQSGYLLEIAGRCLRSGIE